MARPRGAASRGTAARRAAMVEAIWQAMRAAGGRPLSWREMAAAAGVGPATLSHHLGKREAVVAAVLAAKREEGAEALAVLATPTEGGLEASLAAALDHMLTGLERYGVGDILSVGLSEGLLHPTIGPAVLRDALDPMIDALADRLRAHVAAGEMRAIDPRRVAVTLMGPVVLAYAHQGPLGGAGMAPMDFAALAREVASGVARAHGTDS